MAIADMNPDASHAPTDAVCAAKIQKALKRTVRTARGIVQRVSLLVDEAPGGKAAVNTALDTTQAEASAILDKLVTLVNTHKAAGSADVVNPLA